MLGAGLHGVLRKGGSVIAFVRLAHDPSLLHQARIDTQQADAMIVERPGGGRQCQRRCNALRAAAPRCGQSAPDSDLCICEPSPAQLPPTPCWKRLSMPPGARRLDLRCAGPVEQLFGDTLTANVLLLGVRLATHGLVPLSLASLERALGSMKWRSTPTNSPLLAVAWRQPLRKPLEQLLQGHASPATPSDPTQVALTS